MLGYNPAQDNVNDLHDVHGGLVMPEEPEPEVVELPPVDDGRSEQLARIEAALND